MLDTFLITLSFMQFGSSFLDSYTTELCFIESRRTGIYVYENNPLVSIPLGKQPSLTEFIISDLISVTTTYFISKLLQKTYLKKLYWIPQVSMIFAHSFQSNINYKLYQRLKGD